MHRVHTRDVRARIMAASRLPKPGHPCTRETARCAIARDYAHRLPDCCRTHLRGLVADVVVALDECGVTWWADYGTLLGAVRNPMTTWADYPWLAAGDGPIPPGIVPHDKDADFGALHTDWSRLLKVAQLLRAKGYHVMVRTIGYSLKVLLSEANHTNLDLFTWMQRLDGSLFRNRYIAVDRFKGRDFPKAMLVPPATVEWEGITLRAPADPAAFCQMRYGPNWMVPVNANHDGVIR